MGTWGTPSGRHMGGDRDLAGTVGSVGGISGVETYGQEKMPVLVLLAWNTGPVGVYRRANVYWGANGNACADFVGGNAGPAGRNTCAGGNACWVLQTVEQEPVQTGSQLRQGLLPRSALVSGSKTGGI